MSTEQERDEFVRMRRIKLDCDATGAEYPVALMAYLEPARPAEWVDPLGDIARFAGYARERHEALLRDAAEKIGYGEQET